MPEKLRLSEMSIDERREFLKLMARDRTTVATQYVAVDLRAYQRMVTAVCDALLGESELSRSVVAATGDGAVLISMDLIGSASPCDTYSPEPNLLTDALGFFDNLDQWLDEQTPSRAKVPDCPLAGHTDRWTLFTSEAKLWRFCPWSGDKIDEFLF